MIDWIKNVLTEFPWNSCNFGSNYINYNNLYINISIIIFLIGCIGLIYIILSKCIKKFDGDFEDILSILLYVLFIPIAIAAIWLFCALTYYVIIHIGLFLLIAWLATKGREEIKWYLKKYKNTKSISNNYYKNKFLNI